MPKVSEMGKQKPKGDPCIACEGSGISTSSQKCIPCRGSGLNLAKKTWICPKCKTVHEGFIEDKCRNKKCPTKIKKVTTNAKSW